MDVVRIGMVGARYGAAVHLQNLAALRGTRVQVTGICSQSRESAEVCARRFEIPFVTTDFAALLGRKDVDAVDLCVPPALHHRFAIQAAEAGKHVIVEKPLTGYFGEPGDPEPIGDRVPREKMQSGARKNVRKNVAAVLEAVRRNHVTLGYAENWVYAPPVEKLRRLIQVSGGAILDLRAEENHSGSHSPYSRHWRHTGGGTLLRMGVHPVGAVLHLKAFEGQVNHGRPIRPVSVVADVAPLMRLDAARREQRKWIPADPEDVENWGSVLIAFEDGTRAVVSVTDAGLGGLQEKVSVYMTNAVLHANLAQNTAVQAYAPDGAIFGDEYFTEKLETKAGWSFPSPDEDWFRGYPQEMRDFVDAIREGREPLAGVTLAADCIEVIYAAYLAAEEGRRVPLQLF
ncbi:MAG: Gfo/Idh/MocA family oxidoreductase [candidate division NC10 bacterium]|nr:Gfo/Idh/MocA family oxidoreductase [candidate division NC10 bacterium]